MMKWFAAVIGYSVFRFPGAVLGFLVGSAIDSFSARGNGSIGRGAGSVYKDIRRGPVSAADFELHLLSLCSIVIKADGKVSQRELDYVRQYFVSTYGKQKANAIFKTFNDVIKKKEISTQQICMFMTQRTRYEVRLQLLHFLFGIALPTKNPKTAPGNLNTEYPITAANHFIIITSLFTPKISFYPLKRSEMIKL